MSTHILQEIRDEAPFHLARATYERKVREVISLLNGADKKRLEAGRILLDLRPSFTRVSWHLFCYNTLNRSPRDADKIIALAKSADPVAALEVVNQAQREARLKNKKASKPFNNAICNDLPRLTKPTIECEVLPMVLLPVASQSIALSPLDQAKAVVAALSPSDQALLYTYIQETYNATLLAI